MTAGLDLPSSEITIDVGQTPSGSTATGNWLVLLNGVETAVTNVALAVDVVLTVATPIADGVTVQVWYVPTDAGIITGETVLCPTQFSFEA
jgi:hypothetical protein